MPNYFVSYDLMNEKNYPGVVEAIQRVDPNAIRILYSLWYLKSGRTTEGVFTAVAPAVDADDKLVVILSTEAWGSKDTIGFPWDLLSGRWGGYP